MEDLIKFSISNDTKLKIIINFNEKNIKHKIKKWLKYIKTSNKRWRKMMPDYAKTTYKLEDPNIDDMRYQKVTTWLLKHDWYEGKVNQFKHYTQKNINLIR